MTLGVPEAPKIGKKWFRAISGMPLYPCGAWTLVKYILESPSRENMNILMVLGTFFTKIVYYYVLHMKAVGRIFGRHKTTKDDRDDIGRH